MDETQCGRLYLCKQVLARLLLSATFLPKMQLSLKCHSLCLQSEDNSYIERIENKSKQLFLILVGLGIADEIFNVVDHLQDDEILPASMGQLYQDEMLLGRNELCKRFFVIQYCYVLRDISKGDCLHFDTSYYQPGHELASLIYYITRSMNHYLKTAWHTFLFPHKIVRSTIITNCCPHYKDV